MRFGSLGALFLPARPRSLLFLLTHSVSLISAPSCAAARTMKLVARGGGRPALAPTVAFAFCDLAGAGPRALMALEPPPGCTMSAAELDVEGLPDASRAFAAESARSAPVELITFTDASGAPHTSLLLLLAPVPEAQQTAVAAAVFEFVTQAAHGAGSPGARAAVRAEP